MNRLTLWCVRPIAVDVLQLCIVRFRQVSQRA
jgi:hypothetical protein